MNDVVSQHHQSKASNALVGKTARACDSCLVKRARWFCPGDDAFLCQACDSSVHSANPLASRHKRVRLDTSSTFKTRDSNPSSPAWHHGFTRKARTPRQAKPVRHLGALANHLVPEINSEDPFLEENEEEQLFCRVPVFDAFAEEFSSELIKGEGVLDLNQEIGSMVMDHDLNLEDLLSNCEEDLAGFVGDVESLLGGTNGDEFSHVKVEEENEDEDEDEEVKAVIASHFDPSLDVELNWDFDIDREEEVVEETKTTTKIEIENVDVEKRMLLRLNYEAVVEAWASQGSPWTDGIRPQFDLDEFMVACLGSEISHERGGGGDRLSGANIAGREARVSRYREKRRTRLFSKKIRYEVRKLNAEKRPRIKGRFVKRTTFSGSSLPYQLINK